MPETIHSSASRPMNQIITRTLKKFASILRNEYKKGTSIKVLREKKVDMMESIYIMLCTFIGKPPKLFDWQIRDKNKKFIRIENLTPVDFYKNHVDIKLKEKVCLIHCPMSNKKFNQLYTIKYLGNVVEGQEITYLNISLDEIKKAVIKSLKNNEAVWFGCDVGKRFSREQGVLDIGIYDYENVFQTDFKMNKQTRLEYGDSEMTHAMLLTGVDIKKRNSTKWKIENSWGTKSGNKGYMMMTDEWFDEYTYEIVVDKKYISKRLLKYLDMEPVVLAPWDPMGALASN
jgi:bleomycin hydrolase